LKNKTKAEKRESDPVVLLFSRTHATDGQDQSV